MPVASAPHYPAGRVVMDFVERLGGTAESIHLPELAYTPRSTRAHRP